MILSVTCDMFAVTYNIVRKSFLQEDTFNRLTNFLSAISDQWSFEM